jgi:adenylate cyclase
VSGLSAAELAIRSGCSEHYVRRLAGLGVLSSREEPFRPTDVQRARFTAGLEDGGISLELLARGLAEGEMSLAGLDAIYPDPASYTSKTYAELAEEAGVSFERVRRVALELGLPQPRDGDAVRDDDARMLSAFLGGWAPAGDEEVSQLARVFGTAIRPLMDSYIRIIGPAFARYFQTLDLPVEARARRLGELGRAGADLAKDVAQWLIQRHLENATTQSAVVNIEDAFERLGYDSPRPAQLPAIAFLDLTGYTALAEERGDTVAAELAARLGELVHEHALAHQGRAVKWLGDGVMFHFAEPADAVEAALTMVEEAPRSGLPPARVGISTGPVVFRDGDYFGRTVNLAARIADHAGPGDVLVSEPVRERTSQFSFQPLEPAQLKGIPTPVQLYRATTLGRQDEEAREA